MEQTSALAKYRIIWERYETFYDSMEQVHEAKQKKEELESLKEQSENATACRAGVFRGESSFPLSFW